jgi:hypothetical protein
MKKAIEWPDGEESPELYYLHNLSFHDLLHIRLEYQGLEINLVVDGSVSRQDAALADVVRSQHGHNGAQGFVHYCFVFVTQ